MPYIKQERRIELSMDTPKTAGELNYELTRSMLQSDSLTEAVTNLIEEYQKTMGLSYQTINDIMGALLCSAAEYEVRGPEGSTQEKWTKQEILTTMMEVARTYYQTVARPYEDTKIEENGDVGYASENLNG